MACVINKKNKELSKQAWDTTYGSLGYEINAGVYGFTICKCKEKMTKEACWENDDYRSVINDEAGHTDGTKFTDE